MIEAKVSGVYEIRNLVNGHIYVGSSINIPKRLERHKQNLKKGNHHSAYLQRAWDKYGEDSFQFDIVLFREKNELLDAEQVLLDEWKPEYNIALDAKSPTRGRKMSAEFSKKISNRMLGNSYTLGRKRSKEECDAISKGNERKKKTSPKLFLALRDRAKDWGYWISPDGAIVHIKNLDVFCKNNNLSQGNMCGVFNKTRKQHKGWRLWQ